MPLVTRTSTPAGIAANEANGRRSSGPVTPEGIERIRERLQGGFAGALSLKIRGEIDLSEGVTAEKTAKTGKRSR